jgi:hypothetical protein
VDKRDGSRMQGRLCIMRSMTVPNTLTVLTLLAALCAKQVGAQSVAGEPPWWLSVPSDDQSLACRALPLDRASGSRLAGSAYEFRQGDRDRAYDTPTRTIEVEYDRTERPLSLSIHASHPFSGDRATIDVVIAHFSNDSVVFGSRTFAGYDSTGTIASTGDGVSATRQLSASEAQQSRLLVDWLWKQRCVRK